MMIRKNWFAFDMCMMYMNLLCELLGHLDIRALYCVHIHSYIFLHIDLYTSRLVYAWHTYDKSVRKINGEGLTLCYAFAFACVKPFLLTKT